MDKKYYFDDEPKPDQRLLTLDEEETARAEWYKLPEDSRCSWRDYWLGKQRDLTASIVRAEKDKEIKVLIGASQNIINRIDEGLALGEKLDVTPLREAVAKYSREKADGI